MDRAKTHLRRTARLVVLVPFAALLFNPSPGWAAPYLGRAQSFAVLGATTATSTGGTIVTGDVGASPGTSVVGFPPGQIHGGAVHAGDALAAQAHSDLGLAYTRLAGLPCPAANNLTGKVLGTDPGAVTLTPGVYCFNSSAQLGGQLTLDAQGRFDALFIFQIASTLTTAPSSSVVMTGAGRPGNVFWQVGSSATLGIGTVFQGNILAAASITLVTGTSLTGRALAVNAAVTMDTNVVTTPRELEVSVGTNQDSFRTGQTLIASLGVQNPGLGVVADFFIGIILPDGDTIVFFKDAALNIGIGSLSHPATVLPIAAGVNLATPFTASVSPFFTYGWTGPEPPGTYVFFVAALNGGNLVAFSTAAVTFSP